MNEELEIRKNRKFSLSLRTFVIYVDVKFISNVHVLSLYSASNSYNDPNEKYHNTSENVVWQVCAAAGPCYKVQYVRFVMIGCGNLLFSHLVGLTNLWLPTVHRCTFHVLISQCTSLLT